MSRMILGLLLLNAVVLGLAGLAIYEDWLEHQERARISVQNISKLLEREVSAVFDRIGLGLHLLSDDIERQIAAGSVDEAVLNVSLAHHQSHLPEVVSLRVTDANGMVRFGAGVSPGAVIDVSDRDYFISQRGNPKAGFVIGKPVRARISQVWAIPVSRRLNRPNGEFAGIVYVNIPVAYFVERFSELNLGASGLVALRSEAHMSVARYPEMTTGGGVVGEIAVSDQLRELLKDKPSSVTYMAPSPVDRIERTFSYHKLLNYPLYVVVGLATQDVMQEWWWDSTQTAGVVLLFSLMTAFLGWLLIKAWCRQVAVEQALRESEQRLSQALESGNFSVWDWNLQTGAVQLSIRGKQLFGFAESEIGNHIAEWAQLCHPDDRAQVLARMKDHFRGRAPIFSVDFRVRCKGGNWKWILSRGSVVARAVDGRPLRMIGTHTDISERHEREQELRLSAAVFNLADEAMVVTNSQNEIISVNPAFTCITGYTPEEVIGRNPRLLSARTHPKEFYQAMWASLIEAGSWRGEVLNRKKSGEVYVEWLSIKRLNDDKGELTQYVAVFSDITARKMAERRMQHLALHDVLTDLPNRALLSEHIEHALLRAKRDKTRLALMYFDLDKFKPINDKLGHEVGDLLLQAVAKRVRDCVRASDTVARIGGDEFVVLLPTLEADLDAMGVAEKIRVALCQPFEISGHVFEISTSIGLALYPEHGTDEQALTRNADAAMYQAKTHGRNQVVLYALGM